MPYPDAMRTALPGLLLLALTANPAAPAGAARVVSLNLCADDYLLTLAPEQAAGVTRLARDPALSVVAAAARAVATVRADPEAVLALHPDLVLAARFGAQATLATLRAQGVRIEAVALPDGFPAIRAETRRLGALLGEPARAAAAVAAMDHTLDTAARWPGTSAVLLEPRGWTAGAGSLGGAVLAAAGLRDLGDGRAWSLERVVATPPALLVRPEAPRLPSLATDFLRHPVLRGIPARDVPPAALLCGGPWTAEAVRALAP